MSVAVDTKYVFGSTFGNDTLGFIRVRKRKLKGGAPERPPFYRERVPQTSASFDLVRAVRVNGKPRHAFVLGLGSQKERLREHHLVWFWSRAVARMKRHGLKPRQRRRLADEMVRKGARLPTIAQCRAYRGNPFWDAAVEAELVNIIKRQPSRSHARGERSP